MILTGFGLLTTEKSSDDDDDHIQEYVTFRKHSIVCQNFIYIVLLTTLAPSRRVFVLYCLCQHYFPRIEWEEWYQQAFVKYPD